MDQESTFTLPDGLRDLQATLEADWPARSAAIPAWHPRNEETPEEKAAREKAEAENGDEEETGDEGDEPQTFDRTYVEKLRRENAAARKRAQEAEAKAKQYEDAEKSDAEKKDEALSAAQERAAYADRLDVALDKAPEGMSIAQVRKLAKRLTGKTREELETDAEELFADFAPSKGEGDEKPGATPRERLRPGAAPSSEPEETDPRKLASMVPRD